MTRAQYFSLSPEEQNAYAREQALALIREREGRAEASKASAWGTGRLLALALTGLENPSREEIGVARYLFEKSLKGDDPELAY